MVPYSRLLAQVSSSSTSPIVLLPHHVWHTLFSLYHPTRVYSSNHSELPCTVHIPRPMIRSGDKVDGCIYPIELRIHWYSTAGQVRAHTNILSLLYHVYLLMRVFLYVVVIVYRGGH